MLEDTARLRAAFADIARQTACALHGVAQQLNMAFWRFVAGDEAAEMAQKGGFSGTGRPEQRHHFALLDGQINGMQSLVVVKGLAQFLDADDSLHVQASR
ncbi:hypothetical protein D3C75_383150 [compost metagenome]